MAKFGDLVLHRFAMVLALVACSGSSDSADDSPTDGDADTDADSDSDSDADTDSDTDADSDVDGDEDGDGSPDSEDCDDSDPNTYPGADEPCSDPADRNCDGVPGVDNDSNECRYNGHYEGVLQIVLETGDYDGSAPNLIDPATLESTTCVGTVAIDVDVTAGGFDEITGTLSSGAYDDSTIWMDWLSASSLGLTGCEFLDLDIAARTSVDFPELYGAVSDTSCAGSANVSEPVLDDSGADPTLDLSFGVGMASISTAWHFQGSVSAERQ